MFRGIYFELVIPCFPFLPSPQSRVRLVGKYLREIAPKPAKISYFIQPALSRSFETIVFCAFSFFHHSWAFSNYFPRAVLQAGPIKSALVTNPVPGVKVAFRIYFKFVYYV